MTTPGGRLLRRLRARTQPPAPEDPLPALPTAAELTTATEAAARGRRRDTDTLTGLLLAITSAADATLTAQAEQALAVAVPRLWLALDVSARASLWHAPRWSNAVARRLVTGDPGALELTLAACHPDGYVREAAVARLSELTHARTLPALALRAADWVPQVRARARLACERRLTDAPTETWPALAPVAFALNARLAGTWLVEALTAHLRDPETLADALRIPDRRARRAAYQVALPQLPVSELLRAARTDHDLRIRVTCADAAIRAARATGDTTTSELLLTSRTALIRAEAVHTLALAGDLAPANAALTDRSALVRSTAQAALTRAAHSPAPVYRRLLAPPADAPDPAVPDETGTLAGAPDPAGLGETGIPADAPDPAAIAGLGETGTPADASLLRPWLAHPRPRGRAEAVRALRRLGDTPADLLLPLLADPSTTVTRQATQSLRPKAGSLDEGHLRDLLAVDRPSHVRTAAHRLLRERDVWTRLIVALELADDPLLRDLAHADLVTWLTHEAATTYAMPDPPRSRRLDTLLTQAAPVLGSERIRVLRFHLGLSR